METFGTFFQWETPNGPDLPFSGGILLFDIIRMIVITMSFSLGLLSLIVTIRPAGTLGQKARLLALGAIFLINVATGTASHIGDYGHWRLITTFFIGVVGNWGMWSYYRYEKPAEIRPYEKPDE